MVARRILFAGGIVIGLTLIDISLGNAQPGLDGGAVLRNPFDDDPPAQAPARGGPTNPGSFTLTAPTASTGESERILSELTVDPRYAMNKDIEPTPNLGPWMVCIHSYIAKEAPEWSREFASELRSHYKMSAYVFTYGIEERKQEYERVKQILDKQRDFLKDRNIEVMYAPRSKDPTQPAAPIISNDLPINYAMNLTRVKHIQLQCAILVGGYPTEDAAHNALLSMRNLPQPDPARVKLDVRYYRPDPEVKGNTFKSADAEYVNPFRKAFVCRNPSIKHAQQQGAWNMKLLTKLNADEPYSLLNCKKPLTLAIKQFRTFTTVQSREEKTNLFDSFVPKTRAGSEGVDQAAHDAHGLAELLRKNKLDAFVLHTEFSSIVCVGGYENLEDPSLRTMQSNLETRLRAPELARLMFFPRPMPMQVPH